MKDESAAGPQPGSGAAVTEGRTSATTGHTPPTEAEQFQILLAILRDVANGAL